MVALENHVIGGSNLNHNAFDPEVHNVFEQHGLLDIINTTHGLTNAPATFICGQTVIDGLWATPSVSVIHCGYFAPGNSAPGDHSLLWMDVQFMSVLGHIPHLPPTFKAWWPCLYDTKTTKKYLDSYQSPYTSTMSFPVKLPSTAPSLVAPVLHPFRQQRLMRLTLCKPSYAHC